MQTPQPLAKSDRHRLIGSLITRQRIGTQFELLRALEAGGCRITQATISRDIRELGLEKTRDALGRPRYVPAQRERAGDPVDALATLFAQFVQRVTAAENIVVVQSELGSAPAIGRALDRLEHARIVGTLAGDDTCLVIAPRAPDARALARELGALIRA